MSTSVRPSPEEDKWAKFGIEPNPSLCPICSTLTDESLAQGLGRIQHQLNFVALEESATSGCHLCTVFYTALINTLRENEITVLRSDSTNSPPCEISRNGADVDHTQSVGYMADLSWGDLVLHTEKHDKNLRYWRYSSLEYHVSNGKYLKESALVRLSSLYGRINHIIGRYAPEYPDFKLCSTWVKACSRNHNQCGYREDSDAPMHELPSRLIHVGEVNKSEPRLVETKGQRGDYISLSHCWGDEIPLQTKLSNYAEHLKAIPFLMLPKTFQDAVTIVRKLGYQYLWIDSLCIIQDSQTDWEIECGNMASIYESSVFNITGLNAHSANGGIFHSRLSPAAPPCLIPQRSIKNDRLIISNLQCQKRGYFAETRGAHYIEETIKSSKMAHRGWILQERLLSPRMMYFGNREILFECREAMCSSLFWGPLKDNNTHQEGSHQAKTRD